MSEYSDNLYEIEWAVWGQEIVGELYKLTGTEPVFVKAVQVGLPDGLRATEFVATLDTLLNTWTDFARAGFVDQGWKWNEVPPLVVDWTKIYRLEYNRLTYRVPVQVSYDYIELITEVSV